MVSTRDNLYQSWGTNVSFSNVTVALWELSSSLEAGVTESDVIFPLFLVRDPERRIWWRPDRPEAEEISHFLLARLRSNVLDLVAL